MCLLKVEREKRTSCLPVDHLIGAAVVERVVETKRLILQEFREVDFLLWLVYYNDIFVWYCHDINLLPFYLCTTIRPSTELSHSHIVQQSTRQVKILQSIK